MNMVLSVAGPVPSRLFGQGRLERSPFARCRRLATTAGALQTPPAGASAITADTDVAAAISAACDHLGRPFPADAVRALEDNWYSTAAELVALPDDTARSLGIPLRLKTAVADMLASRSAEVSTPSPGGSQLSAGGAEAAAAAGQPSGTSLLSAAAQSPSGMARDGSDRASHEQLVDPAPLGSQASSSTEDLGQGLASGNSGSGDSSAIPGTPAWAALAIEERRCPKLTRFQNRQENLQNVTKRARGERYALAESETSEGLRREFAAFHRFCTVRFFGAQAEPISDVTAAKYADHIRGMLGYLHRQRGVPLEDLSFSQLLPSSGREGVSIVFDYILWLHQTRDISVRTEGLVVRSAAAAAKFLYHNESKVNPSQGDRPYSDLGVIKELRAMSNAVRRQSKVAPRSADEEKKWLEWPEYLQVCQELWLECAGRDEWGRKRAASAVAWSLQRYLIFSILSCVPDRQRTLRELEVGRTLVKDREGRWVIRHGPSDYKTGRAYGERPPLTIAPHIYPELEAFMHKWRACLQPQHSYLFTQRNGEPLTDKSLYKIFWTTAYRLTGKKTNPHLVRDSIVTYLRGGGATERELEALAIYMGHSVEMQRSTYDRRTKQQKVEPAVELLASLNRKAMSAGSSDS